MEMKYFDLIKPGTTHDFVKYRRVAVVVSLIANALVLAGVLIWPGLNYGVDFAGGTELQVHFKQKAEAGDIRDLVGKQGFGEPTVQEYGNKEDNQFLVRVERIALLTPSGRSRSRPRSPRRCPGCRASASIPRWATSWTSSSSSRWTRTPCGRRWRSRGRR